MRKYLRRSRHVQIDEYSLHLLKIYIQVTVFYIIKSCKVEAFIVFIFQVVFRDIFLILLIIKNCYIKIISVEVFSCRRNIFEALLI